MEQSLEELLAILPNKDYYLEELRNFSSDHRKLEWLSVRALLYQLLGKHFYIDYLPSGKPFLKDSNYTIGISHTKDYVSVIIGKGIVVGIDIEYYSQRVKKVSSRFLRADEEIHSYLGEDTWSYLLHWSAKEVMFKCMNSSDVDFIRHLKIEPFPVKEKGSMTACEFKTSAQKVFNIQYQITPDFVLTWYADSSM